MTHRDPVLFVAGLLLLSPGVAAADKVFSGPQPGEPITSFKVLQVTGKDAGKELEIVDGEKGGPTFLVFLHKVTEPAIGLMISLDWYARKLEGLTSHYVILTKEKGETEASARRWGSHHFSKSSLGISLDGVEGPGRYGLNRKVAMTLLVAKDKKVVANFALQAPNGTDAPKILAALAKLMGKPAPSYEKIRKELRAERDRRREMRRRENPVFKLAPNPDLGKLMLRMVHTEIRDPAHFKKVATEMREWAGDDAKKKAALAKYAKTVLGKSIKLTDPAREALKKFAKG